MIFAGLMIRLGKTYGNLMVDVQSTNQKLEDRTRRIVKTVLNDLPSSARDDVDPHVSALEDDEIPDRGIRGNGASVKQAIIALR